jgi:GH25 family lysozyme M1 (1,4-beta-N-acetylmuramidase)
VRGAEGEGPFLLEVLERAAAERPRRHWGRHPREFAEEPEAEGAWRDAERADLEPGEEAPFLAEGEAPPELAVLSPSELKAVRITSTFETGRAGGFGGLSGNFDGQGLSFGLMNWTISAGSLVPLLQKFLRTEPERFQRIFGADAPRFRDMVFATRKDPQSGRSVRDVEAQMAFVRGQMNDAAQRNIVEPWRTYFQGLEHDPAFRRIEVEAARKGLAHARRWFERFGWKTERGFAFLFDLVSSHGPWWLDAPAFKGARERLLAERLAARKAALGRAPGERETMEVIANFIADISNPRWREQVRVRKLWFVRGVGKVHGSAFDLAKDFGVTDAPPDLGAGSPAAPAPGMPTPTAPAGVTGGTPVAGVVPPPDGSLVLGLDTASVGENRDPDWGRAASGAGIRFGIIRSNWGTYPDPTFGRDWPKMKAAGMVRGAYLFLRFHHPKYGAAPDPAAQAKTLCQKVGPLEQSDLPPSLDVEFPGGLAATRSSAEVCLEGVRKAWKVLKEFYGAAPLVYTSGRVWHEDLQDLAAPDLRESPLWLARYPYRKGPAVLNPTIFAGGKNSPPVPKPWGDADNWWIHQYQGDAVRLPGFPSGNVDLNRFNVLKAGARGDRVRWVQRRLGVAETGGLDPETERALRAFREAKGLGAAPEVDLRTFAFLCWSRP